MLGSVAFIALSAAPWFLGITLYVDTAQHALKLDRSVARLEATKPFARRQWSAYVAWVACCERRTWVELEDRCAPLGIELDLRMAELKREEARVANLEPWELVP
jgi:hypothetical protein